MLRDLSEYEQNYRTYGGAAGQKVGLTIDNEYWMVKYPGNLKSRNLKNIVLSYSNSPVCEYLGSHVYEMLGIDVHTTELAYRNKKLVVMCKDFLKENERLIEFREFKATYEPAFIDLNGNLTDGTGSNLNEILLVIRDHPILKSLKELELHFWKMFVTDFILGNPDRNNGNWGLILNGTSYRIAPVYDNGNSLNDKWDSDKMKYFLNDTDKMNGEAYGSKQCFFTYDDGKSIKPYKFLKDTDEIECKKALVYVLQHWEMKKFISLIDSVSILTDIQKEFYKEIVSIRIEKLKGIA